MAFKCVRVCVCKNELTGKEWLKHDDDTTMTMTAIKTTTTTTAITPWYFMIGDLAICVQYSTTLTHTHTLANICRGVFIARVCKMSPPNEIKHPQIYIYKHTHVHTKNKQKFLYGHSWRTEFWVILTMQIIFKLKSSSSWSIFCFGSSVLTRKKMDFPYKIQMGFGF